MAYIVVFKNISDSSSHGVFTWTDYDNKEEFQEMMTHPNMKAWYEVVEEDVTQERALELCKSPEAFNALLSSETRKMKEAVEKIGENIKVLFQDLINDTPN